MKRLVFALLLLVWSASPSWAAGLTLTMQDGLVSLDAQDVTVRQILTEWARIGKTHIVNVERITGGPITLKFDDIPEKQALDIVLRTDPGLRGAAARDASCRCFALRPHTHHGDDDRGCAASAAAAGTRIHRHAYGMYGAAQGGANVTQLRPNPEVPLSPGTLPEPADAADQMDDPAIAAAAAAGLVPVPALNPGPSAVPAPLMPPGGAAQQKPAPTAPGVGVADESVERTNRYRAAESRAASPGRAGAADHARASAAGRPISVRRDTIPQSPPATETRSPMPEIDRYRPEDQRGVEALYRRVFGPDAAAASRLRWDWQYRRNPNNPDGQPLLWVVREGPTIIGHYATMPVRLSLGGKEIQAAWGTDAMVAPERQRRGLGEELFRTWDRSVGAALGLGLSESSSALLKKIHFPDVAPIPGVVKPLTRRAVRMPQWPMALNRFVSAVTLPIVRVAARVRPLRADVEPIRRFDASFTDLWERLADRFELAVRRDAAYLNWKFIEPPHVRYSVAALKRDGRPEGYAVYRHAQEPRGRVTLLVDFLADTHDEMGFKTLLRWVDAEAREAGSDKIRCYASHFGFRRIMRHSGYFQMRPKPLTLAAKINAVTVPAKFYRETDDWHITLGDSDQDVVSIREWD